MELLFFELLLIALAKQAKLSRKLDPDEWRVLYEIANKQALVGLCFSAVQKICNSDVNDYCGMDEALYYDWMWAAANIQESNETINEVASELCSSIRHAGFNCCIIKGPSLCRYYGPLAYTRQSGDIDVWMWPAGYCGKSHNSRVRAVLKYAQAYDNRGVPTYHNIAVHLDNGIQLELHYTPSWRYSPGYNRKLQRWFDHEAPNAMSNIITLSEGHVIYAPMPSFDLVFIPIHMFRHVFGDGIGMRQLIDYYCAIKYAGENVPEYEDLRDRSMATLDSFGLRRFVSGIMYVLNCKLGMEYRYLLCEPSRDEGEFILNEMLCAGDFGKYDIRFDGTSGRSMISVFFLHVKRNYRFIRHYPSEVLWCPFWKIWHQLWRRTI